MPNSTIIGQETVVSCTDWSKNRHVISGGFLTACGVLFVHTSFVSYSMKMVGDIKFSNSYLKSLQSH